MRKRQGATMSKRRHGSLKNIPQQEDPGADVKREVEAAEQIVQRVRKDFVRVNAKRLQLRRMNLGPDTFERIEVIARYESVRRELSKAKLRLRVLLTRKKRMQQTRG